MGVQEDIKDVEDEIRKTPYNKATSHHIGKLILNKCNKFPNAPTTSGNRITLQVSSDKALCQPS
jgi:ribosome-interacting GTPase 1